jgi:hypothetical protein
MWICFPMRSPIRGSQPFDEQETVAERATRAWTRMKKALLGVFPQLLKHSSCLHPLTTDGVIGAPPDGALLHSLKALLFLSDYLLNSCRVGPV